MVERKMKSWIEMDIIILTIRFQPISAQYFDSIVLVCVLFIVAIGVIVIVIVVVIAILTDRISSRPSRRITKYFRGSKLCSPHVEYVGRFNVGKMLMLLQF